MKRPNPSKLVDIDIGSKFTWDQQHLPKLYSDVYILTNLKLFGTWLIYPYLKLWSFIV